MLSFFSPHPFFQRPIAVPVQQTTEPYRTHNPPITTDPGSPQARGERRRFSRVSEDVAQERRVSVKVRGAGDGQGQLKMVVRGSDSVAARNARTRASGPARGLSAYWNGAQACLKCSACWLKPFWLKVFEPM